MREHIACHTHFWDNSSIQCHLSLSTFAGRHFHFVTQSSCCIVATCALWLCGLCAYKTMNNLYCESQSAIIVLNSRAEGGGGGGGGGGSDPPP